MKPVLSMLLVAVALVHAAPTQLQSLCADGTSPTPTPTTSEPPTATPTPSEAPVVNGALRLVSGALEDPVTIDRVVLRTCYTFHSCFNGKGITSFIHSDLSSGTSIRLYSEANCKTSSFLDSEPTGTIGTYDRAAAVNAKSIAFVDISFMRDDTISAYQSLCGIE